MVKKTFLFLFLLSLLLFGFDKMGWLAAPKSQLEQILAFRIELPEFNNNQELKKLREENIILLSQLVDQQNLINENNALRIQLGAKRDWSALAEKELLPARVLAAANDFLIIDKGEKSSIKIGTNAIYKNILLGKVVAVSASRSRIELVTKAGSKIPAKSQKGALGIVASKGGADNKLILQNVTSKETLETGDLILTRAEEEFLPDLLLGKVSEVERQESAIFQQAKLDSPVNPKQLDIIYLIL